MKVTIAVDDISFLSAAADATPDIRQTGGLEDWARYASPVMASMSATSSLPIPCHRKMTPWEMKRMSGGGPKIYHDTIPMHSYHHAPSDRSITSISARRVKPLAAEI